MACLRTIHLLSQARRPSLHSPQRLLQTRPVRLSGPRSVPKLPRKGGRLLSWSCCCWMKGASGLLHLQACFPTLGPCGVRVDPTRLACLALISLLRRVSACGDELCVRKRQVF